MKKKLFTVLLATAALSMAMSVTAHASFWKYWQNAVINKKGYKYYVDGQGYIASTWKEIDGKWYYFDEDGFMLTDATTPDGYYVNADGVYLTDDQIATENAAKESEAAAEAAANQEIPITVPTPTGYGSVSGNITWQYNKTIGTKGDVGASVYLLPLDYSIKGGGNEDITFLRNTNGKNGVYYCRVDGFGGYVFDTIPTGNYRLFVCSAKTTAALHFKDKKTWESHIDRYLGQFFTPKEMERMKLFIGYQSTHFEDITVQEGRNVTISYDFGNTFT